MISSLHLETDESRIRQRCGTGIFPIYLAVGVPDLSFASKVVGSLSSESANPLMLKSWLRLAPVALRVNSLTPFMIYLSLIAHHFPHHLQLLMT